MNLVKKVQENIFRYKMFSRGARIAIGVSGGPDSICLLDILHKLKRKYDLKIVIAHVNYKLRKKDSDLDEKLVKNLAQKYLLPFENIRITTHQLTINEENLRNIRYAFFEKIQKKHNLSVTAVGHCLDDQAETVLMRILRGSGLRGLGAIKFHSEKIIRPLLNIPKKDILSYLCKNKLPYRIDKTNLGTNFTRNKIRNQLIPYLEKNFNPNIKKSLFRLSQSAADDYDFINRFSKEWLRAKKSLQVSELINLHLAIQKEILRLIAEKNVSKLQEIESSHIEEVLKIIRSKKNKRQKILFKDLKVERKGDKLVMLKEIAGFES